jgi:hypothetical protein
VIFLGTLQYLAHPLHSSDKNQVSIYAVVGSGVGGTIGGLVIGLIGAFFIMRCLGRPNRPVLHHAGQSFDSDASAMGVHPYTAVPHTPYQDRTEGTAPTLYPANSMGHLRDESGYKVEPFILPGQPQAGPTSPRSEESHHSPSALARPSSPTRTTADTSEGSSGTRANTGGGRGQHVYVVHHDGGRAPVSVYTEDGMEVVELPPMYDPASRNAEQSSGAPSGPRPFQQRRQPGAARKGDRRVANSSELDPRSPT